MKFERLAKRPRRVKLRSLVLRQLIVKLAEATTTSRDLTDTDIVRIIQMLQKTCCGPSDARSLVKFERLAKRPGELSKIAPELKYSPNVKQFELQKVR